MLIGVLVGVVTCCEFCLSASQSLMLVWLMFRWKAGSGATYQMMPKILSTECLNSIRIIASRSKKLSSIRGFG